MKKSVFIINVLSVVIVFSLVTFNEKGIHVLRSQNIILVELSRLGYLDFKVSFSGAYIHG